MKLKSIAIIFMLLAGNSFAKEPNSNETTKIETPAEPKILSVEDVTTALKDAQISITATQAFRGGLAEAINGIKELIARLKEGSLSQEDRQRINDLEKNLEDLQQKLDAETDSKNTAKEELKDEQDAHASTKKLLTETKNFLRAAEDILEALANIVGGEPKDLLVNVTTLKEFETNKKPILSNLRKELKASDDNGLTTAVANMQRVLRELKSPDKLNANNDNELPGKVDELKQELRTAQSDAKNKQTEIDRLNIELQQEKDAANRDRNLWKAAEAKLNGKHDELRKNLQDLDQKITNANDAKRETEKKLVDEKAAKEEAEQERDAYKKILENFIKDVNNRSISWGEVVGKLKDAIPNPLRSK
jgi:septal ring factor EnvC (AmiA/AmiB activator)